MCSCYDCKNNNLKAWLKMASNERGPSLSQESTCNRHPLTKSPVLVPSSLSSRMNYAIPSDDTQNHASSMTSQARLQALADKVNAHYAQFIAEEGRDPLDIAIERVQHLYPSDTNIKEQRRHNGTSATLWKRLSKNMHFSEPIPELSAVDCQEVGRRSASSAKSLTLRSQSPPDDDLGLHGASSASISSSHSRSGINRAKSITESLSESSSNMMHHLAKRLHWNSATNPLILPENQKDGLDGPEEQNRFTFPYHATNGGFYREDPPRSTRNNDDSPSGAKSDSEVTSREGGMTKLQKLFGKSFFGK
jgi:hypothetical protein